VSSERALALDDSFASGVVAKEASAGRRSAATRFRSKNPRNRREGTRKVKKKPVRLESHY
jgi:hypothetical protein